MLLFVVNESRDGNGPVWVMLGATRRGGGGGGGGRRAAGGQGSHLLRITKIPPQANKKSIYIWNIIQFCTLIKY